MKKYLAAYLQNRPLFYSFIRPRELELFNSQKPFRHPILDFGCGDGFFAKVLFEKEKIEFGVDISESVIKEAKESGVYKNVLVFNKKRLPFKNETFLTVISNCVLEHVDNLLPTLKEIRRVMKKGGRLYGSVMTDKWEDYLMGGKLFGKPYLDWMRKIQRHPNLLTLSGWEKEFQKAGFKIIDSIGYIDKKTARFIELFHYLSIDSIISQKLFNKWVMFPYRYVIFRNFFWTQIIRKRNDSSDSCAVFFQLEKI
jgi:SAM-dependent methyltransferase